MTIEVNANVLAQPREPFWMDEYPEAYVYAGYNAGDHDNKYHTGGQTVVRQTVMDMEVRANIQRVYSDSDSTACVYATAYATAAGDPLTNPDRYMTDTFVQVATTDHTMHDIVAMDTGCRFTILR